ncbi:rRNA-processing protein FCF1 [Colletotrichum tropicale]|nr:rRNA-processing protein FCF1 [Colletotrichum tropicale]
MGVAKKTRKFGQKSTTKNDADLVRHIPQGPSGLYFQSNQDLGPPYHIILDANFFAHTVRHKIDVVMGLMDLLLAKCTPVFRLALRLAKDERFERLRCSHSGTYADDCIVTTVTKNRCYLVGTNNRALRQKLRKVPGVPLIAVGKGKHSVERLPEIAV